MHHRRHRMLEFCKKIEDEVETDRKINKEGDTAVPHCTGVLEMALYDTTEAEAEKELERELSLITKFNRWGL